MHILAWCTHPWAKRDYILATKRLVEQTQHPCYQRSSSKYVFEHSLVRDLALVSTFPRLFLANTRSKGCASFEIVSWSFPISTTLLDSLLQRRLVPLLISTDLMHWQENLHQRGNRRDKKVPIHLRLTRRISFLLPTLALRWDSSWSTCQLDQGRADGSLPRRRWWGT